MNLNSNRNYYTPAPINIITKNKNSNQSQFRVHFYLKNVFCGHQTPQKFIHTVMIRLNKITKVSIIQITEQIDDTHADVSVGLTDDFDAMNLIINKDRKILIQDENANYKVYQPIPSKVFQSYINQNKHLVLKKFIKPIHMPPPLQTQLSNNSNSSNVSIQPRGQNNIQQIHNTQNKNQITFSNPFRSHFGSPQYGNINVQNQHNQNISSMGINIGQNYNNSINPMNPMNNMNNMSVNTISHINSMNISSHNFPQNQLNSINISNFHQNHHSPLINNPMINSLHQQNQYSYAPMTVLQKKKLQKKERGQFSVSPSLQQQQSILYKQYPQLLNNINQRDQSGYYQNYKQNDINEGQKYDRFQKTYRQQKLQNTKSYDYDKNQSDKKKIYSKSSKLYIDQQSPKYKKKNDHFKYSQESQSNSSQYSKNRRKRIKGKQQSSSKIQKKSPIYTKNYRQNSYSISNRSKRSNSYQSSQNQSISRSKSRSIKQKSYKSYKSQNSSLSSSSSDSDQSHKIQTLWVFGIPSQYNEMDVQNRLKDKNMTISSTTWKLYGQIQYLEVVLGDMISQNFLNELKISVYDYPVIIIPSLKSQLFIPNQLARYQVILSFSRYHSQQKVILYVAQFKTVVTMVKTQDFQDKFIVVFSNKDDVKKFYKIQKEIRDCKVDRLKQALKIGRVDRIFTFIQLIKAIKDKNNRTRY